ncbi:MAG TPA: response regulator [Gammaproteobacteria bacterium]|nr:response regulator [Gammaproteobacteria bacterium]
MTDKANILLVDDTPARLLTYEAILGSLGHNLIRARSGDEALGRLLHCEVATILLDVSMPGLDGFETAALIRGHPRSAQTPIIFVTGVHLTDVDRLRGYEMGAVDYVSVPVIPEILRGKVHVLVQLYLQRRELARLNEALTAANAELEDAHSALKAENTRELQSLNQTLEHANAQLTAEIGERRRVEAVLQDAARRKDEFLAILAHELRNPLSAIHNGVQLLRSGDMAPERIDWVRELLARQVKHLTRLIDDLLDVRRITSGNVQLQREPLDLASVLEQSMESVRPLVEGRRHSLRARFPPDALHVEADLVRLSQVFTNLLTNAVKYTPDGGLIEVALETETGERPWALVRVRDSGTGIAPDMLERVFELFAQVSSNESRTHSGLGIGLSLVRGLVELHGGDVRAVSEGLGHGSEFVVRLPLIGAERCQASNGNDAASTAEPPPLRLLIIDDNVDTANGLALHLRESGRHVVRLAQTGRTGVAAAQEFAPEVVLLDIGLPDIDGYEVARRLRADERLRDVPLIALTGFGGDGDRARAAGAGFRSYLVKPVAYEVLSQVLAGLSVAATAAS